MSIIDVEALLAEIPPEVSLDDESVVHCVWVKSEVKKERPNWRDVEKHASNLLTLTHDLDLAVSLTCAVVHNHQAEGLSGLHDGLALLHGLVEHYWETLVPLPLPEEKDNPFERMNSLMPLNQWKDMITPLMNATLCTSPSTGPIGLRQVRIAKGETVGILLKPEEKSSPATQETIDAAFRDCNIEKLQASHACVLATLGHLQALDVQMAEKMTAPSPGLDFGMLRKILQEITALLAQEVEKRAPIALERTDATHSETTPSTTTQTIHTVGAINTRQDVTRALEQICAYYARNEPGSPIPLLLKRALRLVEKNFFEIIQDLAPDSLTQIKLLSGGKEGEA